MRRAKFLLHFDGTHHIHMPMTRAASAIFILVACALAQTHTTIQRGKQTTNDVPDEQASEITRAEEAIQKDEFAAAERLLQKTVQHDPKNYQAWFDLGFVLN